MAGVIQGTKTAAAGAGTSETGTPPSQGADGACGTAGVPAGPTVLRGNPTPAELEALAAVFERLSARARRASGEGGPRRAEWSAQPYAAAGSWAR
jgi:hypothetical protein